jgi:hypothetical protein
VLDEQPVDPPELVAVRNERVVEGVVLPVAEGDRTG